jgi:hypothetical protein
MFTVLLAALLAQATAAPQATPAQPASAQTVPVPVADARQLTLSEPKAILELDLKKLQGTPVGLALSTDGTVYLRLQAGGKAGHYQIAVSPAPSVGQIDQLPAWAATYWSWKSATVSPGDPALKIEVEQRADRTRSVGGNSGGEIAGMTSAALPPGGGGGTGVSDGAAINAANTNMSGQIVTFRLKGQVVAEWSGEVPQPGMRIGWAPAPMGLLAFCDKDGRVHIADRSGHRATIPGTRGAMLPAWSIDGTQIVFLQKTKDRLYTLMAASVR